jgi:hypothetical protein
VKLRIPYLVAKGQDDGPPYYWQPSAAMRARGCRPERLPDEITAAAERARELNLRYGVGGGAPIASVPKVAATSGTITALITAYKRSPHFTRLAPASRRSYSQALDRIGAWMGDKRPASITPQLVHQLYNGLAKKAPVFAHLIVRVGRRLWSAGRLLGLVGDANPWAKQSLPTPPKSGLAWPKEAVEAFVRAADALGHHSMGTAVLLNEWLGQREADLLRVPRSIATTGEVPLRQNKTLTSVRLPVGMVPHLVQRIREEVARQDARWIVSTSLIVSETTGRPYRPDHFRHLFAEIRDVAARGDEELGLPPCPTFDVDFLVPEATETDPDAFRINFEQLQFRHLRHTAVVRMAEAGLDLVLISAVTGHSENSVNQIIKHYAIKTARMARKAFEQRLAHEGLTPTPKNEEKTG